MQHHHLGRSHLALLFGLALMTAGCSLHTASHSHTDPLPDEPQPVGLIGIVGDGISPPAAASWTAPDGTTVVEGTRGDLGYVLPLDIRRPQDHRPAGDRPSAVRTDMLRALANDKGRLSTDLGENRLAEIRLAEVRLAEVRLAEVRLGPDDGHTENETSIDAFGSTVVAGWNQFTDGGLLQGVGRSIDGGLTWTSALFGGHSVMSDPMVASGGGDRWYFGYIASQGATGGDIDVFVRRSDDNAATWQDEVLVTLNNTFDDKPYMAARGDEVLVAYADFSFSPAKIRAVRSLDGGLTFGADTVLADLSTGGNGANPVISPDGTYYVFWRDSFQQFLWMSKSEDQGATWTTDSAIAPMSPLPSTLPPGFRIVNLPVAAAHPDGTLIVLWNDQAFGDGDILSVRSVDGGGTWSAPQRVNDDASGHPQFFPWVDMDASGVAHAVWYDMRHDGSNIDVYYATSDDAGLTWSANQRITAASYTPILPWESSAADFIGDYNGIAAAGGRVYPFYQDAREGNQDVWVAVLESGVLHSDGFESGDVTAWSSSVP